MNVYSYLVAGMREFNFIYFRACWYLFVALCVRDVYVGPPSVSPLTKGPYICMNVTSLLLITDFVFIT